MAPRLEQHRQPWSAADLRELQTLVKQNTPTRVIALKMERTPAAIRQKAFQEGISLKPVNQSPYNRRAQARRGQKRARR